LNKVWSLLLDIAKHDKIMTNNHFTRTATQPHLNRCQLINDQYCNAPAMHYHDNSSNRHI